MFYSTFTFTGSHYFVQISETPYISILDISEAGGRGSTLSISGGAGMARTLLTAIKAFAPDAATFDENFEDGDTPLSGHRLNVMLGSTTAIYHSRAGSVTLRNEHWNGVHLYRPRDGATTFDAEHLAFVMRVSGEVRAKAIEREINESV